MTQSIHGHEVMEMMISSGKTWTTESLIEAIETQFGADARFHTCSADNMSAAELVAFLKKKGKFIEKAEGFMTDSSKICQHGH